MASILYRNAKLLCIPNTSTRGMAVIVGPKEVTVAFSLNIRRELFLTVDTDKVLSDGDDKSADNDLRRPISGVTVGYGGKNYKVTTVGADASGTFYNVALSDINSGR